MTELKQCRIKKGLTQAEAARRLGVSRRSYLSYENDESKSDSVKYRFLLQSMKAIDPLDEEHGILSQKEIRSICEKVFADYPVDFCYLFGSYVKENASEKSDVDLLIAADMKGLRFYELAERLREALHKKVDLLDFGQLTGNEALLREIMKEGVRIYG